MSIQNTLFLKPIHSWELWLTVAEALASQDQPPAFWPQRLQDNQEERKEQGGKDVRTSESHSPSRGTLDSSVCPWVAELFMKASFLAFGAIVIAPVITNGQARDQPQTRPLLLGIPLSVVSVVPSDTPVLLPAVFKAAKFAVSIHCQSGKSLSF